MHRLARGKYDPKQCIQDFIKYKDKQIEEAKGGDQSVAKAQARKYTLDADKKEMEISRLHGDTISIAISQPLLNDFIIITRNKVLTLKGAIAQRLIMKSDPIEIEGILDHEFRIILNELASIPDSLIGASELQKNALESVEEFHAAGEEETQRVGGTPSRHQSRNIKQRRRGKMVKRKGAVSQRHT